MINPSSIEAIPSTEFLEFGAQEPASYSCQGPESPALSIPEEEVLQVADAVCRSVSLDSVRLPEEFYPGHLSVALIDAVFFPWRTEGHQASPDESDVKRYCRRFEIVRTRAVQWEMPAVTAQETLGDLIRRYEAYGVDRMADDVFEVRASGCSTKRAAVRWVLDAATALRGIGVDILQDIPSRHPEQVRAALQRVRGVGEETARLLVMFGSGDDFVRGDGAIRLFVASALGRMSVPAVYAAELIRRAAYELVLSPRFLDYVLWQLSVRGDGLAKPPGLAIPSAGLDLPVTSGSGDSRVRQRTTPCSRGYR